MRLIDAHDQRAEQREDRADGERGHAHLKELGLVEAPWKPNWDRSVTWKTSGQPVSV